MCDPVTLSIVAIAATTTATGLSMYSSYQQGKFQEGMMNYQADLARQRAEVAHTNASIESMRLAEQRRQAKASGMTAFAANGMLIDGEENSAPNIWEQDMAAETAWQQEQLRTNAEYEAWGYNANADALKASGRAAKQGATLSMIGTGLKGTSSLIMMGTEAYKMYQGSKVPGIADQSNYLADD